MVACPLFTLQAPLPAPLVQNDSGLSQGLAGHLAAGWRRRGGNAGNKWHYERVSSPDGNCPQRGFAVGFASNLGDLDFDAETNRVLDVALEMTRAALGLVCQRNHRKANRRTCQDR
jgi:hypothetical protein